MKEYAVVLQINPDPNLNFVMGLDVIANIRRPRPVIGDKEQFRQALKKEIEAEGISCAIVIGSKDFLLENPFDLVEEDFEGLESKEIGQPWYAYIHQDGTLHVKRYFGDGDIVEAHDSPFVVSITGPFHATDHVHASRLAAIRFEKGRQ